MNNFIIKRNLLQNQPRENIIAGPSNNHTTELCAATGSMQSAGKFHN